MTLTDAIKFFRDHKALHCMEAFLLIAEGIDNSPALVAAMNCAPSQANRIVSKLTGRGRYVKGDHWVPSTFALVERRRHPHERGYQLLLTADGERLACAMLPGLFRGNGGGSDG
jgi:DNA-binding MarR family transcriptional regulator